MNDLLSTLRERVVTGDGSIGATLFARLGKKYGTSEEFNLYESEGVLALHRDYVAAGAELITTNSFTANRIAFARCGLADRVVEINTRAVELARAAADDRAWVVGSVGPTGELLEPYGDLQPVMFIDWGKAWYQCLSKSGGIGGSGPLEIGGGMGVAFGKGALAGRLDVARDLRAKRAPARVLFRLGVPF